MSTSATTDPVSLFSPVRIGAIECANRIFMAPLTRCHALPGIDAPHALNATYYTQRASAGLIVSEATQVSPQGKGYVDTPGMYSATQQAGWQLGTDAVHAAGGRIVAQLWHVGAVSHPEFQPGDMLEEEVPFEEFGRLAVQAAKQRIIQRVREGERNNDADREALMRELTAKLAQKAASPAYLALQREDARKTVTEFVEKWLVTQEAWQSAKQPRIEVVFSD